MKDGFIEFEKYLGKTFEDVLELNNLELYNKDRLKASNSLSLKMITTYLENNSLAVNFFKKELEQITSISLIFEGKMDARFYENFMNNYQKPNQILKQYNLVSESKSTSGGEKSFKQNLTKRMYSMKEVEFNDNPTLILWNKADYKIDIRFDDKLGLTQVSFRSNK